MTIHKIGSDIEKAATFLKQGKLVAIPTETVYGLAANAFDPIAVASIFEAKKRPHFDPLIVHTHSLEIVQNVIVKHFPEKAIKLAKAFWPGPLTLVLTKNDKIPDLVTSGKETVGVRIPNHEMTLKLLKICGLPLAAPSANPFGYISPTTADHVLEQLGNEVEYILEGGECSVGIESTILAFEDEKPVIYRLGGLTIEEIESVLNEKVKVVTENEENPSAPGMLKSHYAPKKKTILLEKINSEIANTYPLDTAFITFNSELEIDDKCRNKVLSVNGDLKEASSKLFSILRALDKSEYQTIVVENVPNKDLGLAINDRLRRASF
ncbi:MAG: L-threonylcarbamoyladenylate synthase [Cytophagales bacterium]